MKLLAISGGSDSMFLLNHYKNDHNIIVAHVNYNKRKDSHIDEKIVKNFCQKNHITLEVLHINENHIGNFQNWARKKRYLFFKKIYQKYQCQKLIIAHHKDDFLETCLMQEKQKKSPRYYGIRKEIKLDQMNILRPMVDKYWKEDILTACKKYKISFHHDYTNDQNIYLRNKIRKLLQKKTKEEKEKIFQAFKMKNKLLKIKFDQIDQMIEKWKKLKYNIAFFNNLKNGKIEILYEVIHQEFKNAKINKNKIINLIAFIKSKNNYQKQFIFTYKKSKQMIYKKNQNIIFEIEKK